MKKIEAIISKSKFDQVRDALHQVEVNFFSYWDVTGVGNEKKRTCLPRRQLQYG
jgi:nitrogen regulatory protein P-II 1